MLWSPEADLFVKVLDEHGWMIVPKAHYAGDRWRMNDPSSPCPEWADPASPPPQGDPLKDSREEQLKKIEATLQSMRNFYHQNPDGTWSQRNCPPLRAIDGDKKDDDEPPSL
jgi:hypothetical protein